MRLYTLTKPMEGFRGDILNGKIFHISLTEDKRAVYIDISTDNVLLITTRIMETTRDDNLLTLHTESGSVYELADIIKYIPTKHEESLSFKCIDKKCYHKPIYYGDGYDDTTFTFDREITKDEFMSYLANEGYQIKPYDSDKWYCDYTILSCEGDKYKCDKWKYRYVRVYTD